MAILQTRDQVIKSLDKHLQELHALRRAMGEGDTSLMAALPAAPRASAPPVVAALPAGTSAMPQPAQNQAPAFHERAPVIVPPQQPLFQPMAAFLDSLQPRASAPAAGMEKATLEELNAALAFAFAHVSNAQQVPSPPSFTRR